MRQKPPQREACGGADTVLLVPAVVNPEVGYSQAWERLAEADPQVDSVGARVEDHHRESKKCGTSSCLSSAGVCTLRRFIRKPVDQSVLRLRQPSRLTVIRRTGFARWGNGIVKLHIKRFHVPEKTWHRGWPSKRGRSTGAPVHAALNEIGYKRHCDGRASPAGDGAYLKEVNRRFRADFERRIA